MATAPHTHRTSASYSGRSSQSALRSLALLILVSCNLLVFQLFYFRTRNMEAVYNVDVLPLVTTPWNTQHLHNYYQRQQAIAMPSIRVNSTEKRGHNDFYGGKGDLPHLGGFASKDIDMSGVSPAAWKFMIQSHGVKSLLDIGCGRGVSTSWFYMHGVGAHCVEGSHDAVEQSFLPQELITEHDFSRGPWWPEKTVDAAWCVEVLEHIGRNFHKNLMPAFQQAAFLYVSHSTWGGWHHVEVHEQEWWIARFQSFGFVYSSYLTDQVRKAAIENHKDPAPGNRTFNAQHIWLHMLVFINPSVASLPEHAHLLAELGCTDGPEQDDKRPCGSNIRQKEESTLPPEFLPLQLTNDLDAAWEKHVFGSTLVGKQVQEAIAV